MSKLSIANANSHERDAWVEFNEERHEYTVHGETEGYVSVTGVVSAYYSEFDKERCSKQVLSHPKFWSRPGTKYQQQRDYVRRAEQRGAPSHQGLIELWDQNGLQARTAGTLLHLLLENLANDQGDRNPALLRDLPDEKKNYEATVLPFWTRFCNKYEPYRAEWRVYDQDLRVAGTIDLVVKDRETGEFMIVDWKRSKGVSSYSRDNTYMSAPLNHMSDANLNHYSVQLNLYMWILRNHYDIPVSRAMLIVFHPPSYKRIREIPVPHLRLETDAIIYAWRHRCQRRLWTLPSNGDYVRHRSPDSCALLREAVCDNRLGSGFAAYGDLLTAGLIVAERDSSDEDDAQREGVVSDTKA